MPKSQQSFNPSILRHSGNLGAADETVLNKVHKHKKVENFVHVFCKNLKALPLADDLTDCSLASPEIIQLFEPLLLLINLFIKQIR
jgi:hypothetical protein